MSQCIKTGCWLYEEAAHRRVWGDLHKVIDPNSDEYCFVFNAVMEDGETAWQHIETMRVESRPTVTIMRGHHCFERRGVIVFMDCAPNFILEV